ncbi:MAG: hypothetical protein KDD48_01675 [Bdellovibrionales bacterium]|nr:hypothetical protein [Bdellovibrionales bacterium]
MKIFYVIVTLAIFGVTEAYAQGVCDAESYCQDLASSDRTCSINSEKANKNRASYEDLALGLDDCHTRKPDSGSSQKLIATCQKAFDAGTSANLYEIDLSRLYEDELSNLISKECRNYLPQGSIVATRCLLKEAYDYAKDHCLNPKTHKDPPLEYPRGY